MQQESLKNKTIKGVGWSAADAFLGQGVTFIVGLVLARLLSPDEYGLIGICLIFTTVLNGIVDSGFSNALIRKKNVTDEDYNTMFMTNMAISIVLYVLLFISAPLVSNFFHRIELTALVRVTGLILFLNALSITQVTILTKNIDFKTKTKASLVSAIISGVIGIAMAFMGYGVWSLVYQQLSKQLLYTICLWVLNRWWPKFTFYKESFKYMWGFGWKLLASGILNNVWNQLYQVVIGRYYSPATLGQYTRAQEYASLFSQNLTSIIQRVTFPVLSELQDDKERLVENYRRLIKMSMFVTCMLMIPLGAISEPLIYCLIGPKWHAAATYLPFICISMSLYPLHAINLNMLQVQGRSDLFFYIEFLKKIVSLIPIFIGAFVGVYWMLCASIFTGFIAFLINSWFTGKFLNYSSWQQLKDVLPSFLIALFVGFIVYLLKILPLSFNLIFPLQILVTIIVAWIVNQIINLEEFREIKNIVQTVIKKIWEKI
jgi:teichuronic acid exporter